MKEEPIIFSTSHGNLRGIIHHPESQPSGCIITCHGLFSSKESDKFIALGECFARENFTVLRFDFSGCGGSDGVLENTTITGRREDLDAAVAFMENHLPSSTHRIGLLGSSLGGFIALLAAPHYASLKAVVTWATPFSFEELRKAVNQNTETRLREDFFTDAKRYSPPRFIFRGKNLLVIHGDRDETVPVEHARRIYNAAEEPRELKIVAGADHVFSNPQHRHSAMNASVKWFKKHL